MLLVVIRNTQRQFPDKLQQLVYNSTTNLYYSEHSHCTLAKNHDLC